MMEVPTPYTDHTEMGFFEPFSSSFLREQSFRQSCRFSLQSAFCGVVLRNDPQKVTRAPIERLTDAVCYAAKWLKSSTRRSVE
jgi:hypothetical protein